MAGRRRWAILAVGTLAQAATCSFLYGIPMLVPALRRRDGLSLVQASLLVSAPIVGLLLTLIAWGALADRVGERVVIVTGVAGAAVLLALIPLGARTWSRWRCCSASPAPSAASVNAASGRVVMGWFPVHERGLAMGTRQTAQPLGVALAALVLPSLADGVGPAQRPAVPRRAVPARVAIAVLRASWSTRRVRPGCPGAPAPGSPYRGRRDAGPHPPVERAAGRPAVRRRDVHADLPRQPTTLGQRRRRPVDLRLPGRRRARPDRVRSVVGPGRAAGSARCGSWRSPAPS